MILACGALLHFAAEMGAAQPGDETTEREAETASRAIYEGVLETTASGTRTPDLGGHAGMTEFTDAVIDRIRAKLEAWSSLGATA
jgi:isocitrate dehydrogenase (NAD+)